MLNGLKGMLVPNNNNDDEKNKKNTKRFFLICVAVVIVVLVHIIYTFLSGTAEDRGMMIEYVKTHFHINMIDVTLFSISLIIYLIIKFKKRND